MISVEEAFRIVMDNTVQPAEKTVGLGDVLGCVLDEAVVADRDFPPFDRVTMDGIAIRFARWENGQRTFTIEHTQAAGEPVSSLQDPANAIEVMTGAVLPGGTDTVVRYEDLTLDGKFATVNRDKLERGEHIHRQGNDSRRGEVLLPEGVRVTPAEVAVLAAVGQTRVKVRTMTRAAIISTGNELIPVEQTPLPHQVRRSNAFAIEAAMKQVGWDAVPYHFRDDRNELLSSLEGVLAAHDVVILSGGVSQGKFDFIPEVLRDLGISPLFHHVRQRPGKPFWFGRGKRTVVFALPGNPVSTFLCCYKYILPWYRAVMGLAAPSPTAMLASDFSFAPQLTYFLPVTVRQEEGVLRARPSAGGGSGDFVNLTHADGFLELPAGRTEFKAGEVFPFIPFRQ